MIDSIRPPSELDFVGGQDFDKIGEHFREIFVKEAGLQPHHRVLDIGSGIGRMAIPLTEYLSSEGSYEGFDIVDMGVEWCQHNITPHHPNFRFQLADVFNRGYHPQGRQLACDYRFPFPDSSFDFVFLTSVFTHMMPNEVENYIGEISRVLKVGGRCLATYFLHNCDSALLMKAGRSSIRFDHWHEGCWVQNPNLLEDAVCFPEEFVRDLYEQRGFSVSALHPGGWSGRGQSLTAHDVIVAEKTHEWRAAALNPIKKKWDGFVKRLRVRWEGRAGWRGTTAAGVSRARAYVAQCPETLSANAD